jgi:C4-dicarboxylate-specific signal transduction histidine kinase
MKQNQFSIATAGAALGLTLGLLAAPAATPAAAAAGTDARIGALVRRALKDASKTASSAIVVEVPGSDEELNVAADPADVRRALRDVIEYSAQTMANRSTRRLEVRIARNGGAVDVEFRDSGPGVGADELLAIYGDAAKTAPKDSARELLADSNRLAQSVGGRLLIDSQEGVGTDFLVELPLSKDAAETIASR